MEKALVSFMYESGCRCPDELLHMKVGDMEFNDYGAKVKLRSGKVGSRIILVISCVPHLKAWIGNEHPNPKSSSYLWVNEGSRKYAKVELFFFEEDVQKVGKKTKIEKRITSYGFRRSRYTHLATKIATPALYNYMGQVQGFKVIERLIMKKLFLHDNETNIN